MTEMPIVLTDDPADADRTAISNGLAGFTEAQVGFRDYRSIAVLVKDPETFETIGGMYGRTSYGTLVIDTVYLPQHLRGEDLGSRLLGMMEDEAVARGCSAGFLMTLSFQAPGFYARRGWIEFGRIPCEPPGSARVFFRKTFSSREERAL